MNTFIKNNSLLLGAAKGFNYNPNNLTLVFDTTLGDPNTKTIVVPILGLDGAVPNVTINWGDGTSQNVSGAVGYVSHTYATHNRYVVQISGLMQLLSYAQNIVFVGVREKLIKCLSFGNIGLKSLHSAFWNCTSCNEAPKTLPSTVNNLTFTFFGCNQFNQSLNNWNTANVTRTYGTFQNCSQFNGAINNWNTGNVTNMTSMFQNCTAFNQDIGNWDMRKATDIRFMLYNADSFSKNLGAWNLSGLAFASSLSSFMERAIGLTTADYDATLIGWNNNKATWRTDLVPHFGGSKYSAAAEAARAGLVAHGWTITDGGLAP